MKDLFAIIGLLAVMVSALLCVLALCDWYEHRRWMTAAERERLRTEAREWGAKF